MRDLIPPGLEYFFLLAIYLLILVALFQEQIGALFRRPSFWASGAVFFASWTALEAYGLHEGIWRYSPEKLVGPTLLTIPVEEFVAFGLIHLATCASWEAFRGAR